MNERIKELAEQAFMVCLKGADEKHLEQLERFAELVRQDEREQAEPWDTSDMAHRSGGLSVEQEPVAAVELITIGSEQVIAVAWLDSNAFKVGTKLYTAPPSKPWVSLSDRDITGAAHTEARHPVSILETTDSGLCMQFSETGEWHSSDKRGDFMKVNSFLMSFARAIEAALRSKNT
jgi:hypothetical protein